MRWHKIKAMMYHDFKVIRRVRYRPIEILYFPTITILIWGLFSLYVKTFALQAGLVLLVVNLFWAFAQLSQAQVNTLMMEDIWSGELKQILISGISSLEYYVSRLLSISIISVIVTTFLILLTRVFISYPNYGLLIVLIIPTIICSLAISGIVGSLVITLGREYGFLSWSALSLLIFLSAPFFPVSYLPKVLQYLAQIMPFTFVFEGVRQMMSNGSVSSLIIIRCYITAVIYFLISWPLYSLAFNRAKRTGKLSKFF